MISGGVGIASAAKPDDIEEKEFYLGVHEDPTNWPHPDCGEYSNAHTFIGDKVRWPSGDVGYEVAAGSAESAGIDPGEFREATDAAFDAWDAITGDINLTSGGSDITVKFGGVDGEARVFFARAVVSVNRRTDEIVNTSILLEPIESWKIFSGGEQCPTPSEGPDAYDVQSILTHEIGHALGLGHTSLDAENRLLTMFPIPAYRLTYWRSPNGGDITGIQELYGSASVS